MNTDEADHKLRQIFHELRAQDAQRAPAFARVWGAAARREAAPSPLPWLRLAAAAAAVIAGTLMAALYYRAHSAAAEASAWASLSAWQPSTDALLTFSSTPWGSRVTTQSDCWMDAGASGSETTEESGKETL
jgi:hypothetical protein